MQQYKYTAKNTDGLTIKGSEFAASTKEMLNKLWRRNLIVTSLEEFIKEECTKKNFVNFLFKRKKIKLFDLALFFKQLAAMLEGGLPLVHALDSLESETENRVFAKCLRKITKHIRDGHSFSEGLGLFPGIFSDLIIAIIEAGEKTGSLDIMLKRLSDYLAATDRFNRRIRSAMAYPVFLTVFFVVAITAITLFLVPRFKGIYGGLATDLPLLTSAIFRISDFFVHNLFACITLLFLAFMILAYLFRYLPRGRRLFDRIVLKMPVFGQVIKKATVGKFCKTLSTLLNEGIPAPEALELAARTSGNKIIEEAGLKVSKLILEGEHIPDTLKKAKVFPSLMIQMVSVGMESGNLPEMLDSTSTFYEEHVEVFANIMLTLVEPTLLVVLGVTFAVVVIALYLPMFKLATVVTGAM